MGFSRQEYWTGLPFPSPGDLPDLGIEPVASALQAESLLQRHQACLVSILPAGVYAVGRVCVKFSNVPLLPGTGSGHGQQWE